AEQERRTAEDALVTASEVNDFLQKLLQAADPRQSGGQAVTVQEVVDRAAASVDRGSLSHRPLVEAGVRETLAGVYYMLAEYGKAEAMGRKALEIRKGLQGDDHQDVASSLVSLGSTLWRTSKFAEAEAMYRRSLEIIRQEHG